MTKGEQLTREVARRNQDFCNLGCLLLLSHHLVIESLLHSNLPICKNPPLSHHTLDRNLDLPAPEVMEILGWFGFFQPKFDTTEEEPWSLLKNTEYLRRSWRLELGDL